VRRPGLADVRSGGDDLRGERPREGPRQGEGLPWEDIDAIWADDPSSLGGPKKDIGRVVDEGLALCEVAGAPAAEEPPPPEPPPPDEPAPPVPDLDLPADNDEGSVWIRANLSLYEQAYRRCEEMVDTSSSNFDPADVNTERAVLAEDARRTSERAAWVAWVACGDGISQTPWPLPELEHLRPPS
jgi:hypothetical protein